MGEFKVFIPTSGIGSRLGDLTKFTNKSLIRVGKKPAISYIIESYPDDTTFVVSLGHFSEHVKDFLDLVYPEKKIEYVTVDKYEGEGSSLLYSISRARQLLNCPFLFHACDTITNNTEVGSIDTTKNTLFGYKKTGNSEYRSFDVNNGVVSKINDKGQMQYDFDYIGMFFISEFEKFWKTVDEQLDVTLQQSDFEVLRSMISSGTRFSYKVLQTWLDIGNVSSLANARNLIHDKFQILDKNDESIFIFKDFVVKFFFDKTTSENRVKRAKTLYPCVPLIIDNKKNFYKYSFVEGNLLSDVANPKKIKLLLDWSKENLWIRQAPFKQFSDTCFDFYFSKTRKRISKFLIDNNMEDSETRINGRDIPKMSSLVDSINKDMLCNVPPYRFHGDFILDNIISQNDSFKLLDWRQDFGGDLLNGDIYYDLAKLNHNLVFNHEIVNKGYFTLEKVNDGLFCDILSSKNLIDCKQQIENFCEENNLYFSKVELLTSVIWINMAPLHIHPLDKFLFYFGKYNLSVNLEKINK